MRYLIITLLAMLALTSCRSSRHASETTPAQSQITTQKPEQQAPSFSFPEEPNFTSRIHATVNMSGQNISTSGHLRMRQGDVIQLSLLDPILGVSEVARLEISPEMVLLIDRYNRRYVLMDYEQISSLAHRTITYADVERLVWQQAMQAGKDEIELQLPFSRPVNLSLRLSSRGTDSKWEAHTTPSEKYTQVSAEEIFRSLTGY